MANEQGWRDFRQITFTIDGVKQKIAEINNMIERLKTDKAAIFDDPNRLAEVVEIVGIHPLYTVAQLQAYYQKAVELQTWLGDNGYL